MTIICRIDSLMKEAVGVLRLGTVDLRHPSRAGASSCDIFLLRLMTLLWCLGRPNRGLMWGLAVC